MFERVRHMLIKEFIQVFRDPRMLRVIFVAPLVQLIVFGYAATTDVRHVATAVYDRDNTPESRALVARFTGSGCFEAVEAIDREERVAELLDHGSVAAVLRLPRGFGDRLAAGRTAQVQVIVDGTDSNTGGIVLGYSAQIVREFSRDVLVERAERLRGGRPPGGEVELRSRAWFNENLESRNYYVPGVIANIAMLLTLILTSMSVVREKEMGTMEQVIVSPIAPMEFIVGKTVPFALIGVADAVLIMAAGTLWFGVPLRGSAPLLLGCLLVFLLTTLGLGLLISTLCGTQQQAMMSAFFVFFPAMLLSGFMFPIANMPEAVQWLTFLDPLRYFLVIVRGVFLKGVGLEVLWPQVAALAVMGTIVFSLAVARFHKTME